MAADRPAGALRGEVLVLWYAVAGWTRQAESLADGRSFSVHRRRAYPAILGAILMAVVVETAAVHLLVSLWLGPVAWVLTGLGLYSVVWLIGDYNAARLLPTVVSDRGLDLRTGLRWRVELTWTEIEGFVERAPAETSVAMALFGKPDLWIQCRQPVVVAGPFGMRRRARVLGVGFDDPRAFRAELETRGLRVQVSGLLEPEVQGPGSVAQGHGDGPAPRAP